MKILAIDSGEGLMKIGYEPKIKSSYIMGYSMLAIKYVFSKKKEDKKNTPASSEPPSFTQKRRYPGIGAIYPFESIFFKVQSSDPLVFCGLSSNGGNKIEGGC